MRPNLFIAAINNRYHKQAHRFGIRVPKTVLEAHKIDCANGNDYWQKSVQTEMNNVSVAFKMLDDRANNSVGYQNIDCHMIFNVKMEHFRHEAQLVYCSNQQSLPQASAQIWNPCPQDSP
jgi:hypothetical protein